MCLGGTPYFLRAVSWLHQAVQTHTNQFPFCTGRSFVKFCRQSPQLGVGMLFTWPCAVCGKFESPPLLSRHRSPSRGVGLGAAGVKRPSPVPDCTHPANPSAVRTLPLTPMQCHHPLRRAGLGMVPLLIPECKKAQEQLVF